MHVGTRIALWRAEKGLTERQAARLIGVSQPTLRAVERGETKRIGLAVAQAFVDALEGRIDLEDFLPKKRRRAAAA